MTASITSRGARCLCGAPIRPGAILCRECADQVHRDADHEWPSQSAFLGVLAVLGLGLVFLGMLAAVFAAGWIFL